MSLGKVKKPKATGRFDGQAMQWKYPQTSEFNCKREDLNDNDSKAKKENAIVPEANNPVFYSTPSKCISPMPNDA